MSLLSFPFIRFNLLAPRMSAVFAVMGKVTMIPKTTCMKELGYDAKNAFNGTTRIAWDSTTQMIARYIMNAKRADRLQSLLSHYICTLINALIPL